MSTQRYACSNGHEVYAEKPPAQCPAVRRGTPCRGELSPAKTSDLAGGLRWRKAKGAA